MTPLNLLDSATLGDDRLDDSLLYPECDGNPMSESTLQYQWIVYIKENLERLFAAVADVFIAADLLWYPEETDTPPAPNQAPDVMVVFGRPKGHRRSYRQWQEENRAPQVVFEILSSSNKTKAGMEAMDAKFRFYETHGVEEYYIYDPYERMLEAYWRPNRGKTDRLVALSDSALALYGSPRLNIRLQWKPGQELEMYYPDGRRFRSFVELGELADYEAAQAQLARQRADQETQRAEQEALRAEQEALRAEQESQRAAQEALRAEQESLRADRAEQQILAIQQQTEAQMEAIARNLQATGMGMAAIAQVLGLSEVALQDLLRG